jgi:uncharacterized protein
MRRINCILAKDILVQCEFSEEEAKPIIKAIAEHRLKDHDVDLSAILYKADKTSRNCDN